MFLVVFFSLLTVGFAARGGRGGEVDPWWNTYTAPSEMRLACTEAQLADPQVAKHRDYSKCAENANCMGNCDLDGGSCPTSACVANALGDWGGMNCPNSANCPSSSTICVPINPLGGCLESNQLKCLGTVACTGGTGTCGWVEGVACFSDGDNEAGNFKVCSCQGKCCAGPLVANNGICTGGGNGSVGACGVGACWWYSSTGGGSLYENQNGSMVISSPSGTTVVGLDFQYYIGNFNFTINFQGTADVKVWIGPTDMSAHLWSKDVTVSSTAWTGIDEIISIPVDCQGKCAIVIEMSSGDVQFKDAYLCEQ